MGNRTFPIAREGSISSCQFSFLSGLFVTLPLFLCVSALPCIALLKWIKDCLFWVTPRLRVPHSSPLCAPWHWLPVEHRIHFKILLITYKALNGLAPQYLSELILRYCPSCPLRSQKSGHLKIPRLSKSTAGGRSFSYLAPKLWNNLPSVVRKADTLCQFKSRLKTHLVNLVYTYYTITFL